MKNSIFIISLILLVCGSMLSGQSLQVTYIDSVVQGNANNDGDISGISVVKNTSSDTVDVRFKRIDANYNALTDSNAICWELCFTPGISVSPASFTQSIEPGGLDTAITHVYPDRDGQGRTGSITYVYFVENNPTDSVAYSVRYEVTPDLSAPNFQEKNSTRLEIFPNPVTRGDAQVDYRLAKTSVPASFEMLNLVGEVVLRWTLEGREGKRRLHLDHLAPGVYYYTLKQEGEALTTKKLIIR